MITKLNRTLLNKIILSPDSLMFLQKNKKSKEDELSLIRRYIAGDHEAQNTLYALVERLLEKAMKTLELKGSYFQDREDTKQEILVAILVEKNASALHNFKGQSQLSTYLWSIMRFKLIDKLRQELVAAGRVEPMPENLPTQMDDLPGELFDLIDRFLDQSSEKDAFILRLRWLEGRDYQSICRLAEERGMQVTPTYIGNLLFRKRKELLLFLKKQGYEIDKQMKQGNMV